MQFENMQGLKCNFISKNAREIMLCMQMRDLCVILKHARAKMQFYKQKCKENNTVHVNEGPMCKNQKSWDGNAM